MKDTITTIYCLCDEFLKAVGWADDPQVRVTSAEVMTVALTAAAYFGGCHETSRVFLHEHGYFSRQLSKSQLNRRWHAIPEAVWQALFFLLGETFKALAAGEADPADPGEVFLVDSFPVPVCDNIRIRRCRIYRDEAFRGYCASKRRYFYGLRVHLLVTRRGQPVEFALAPGEEHDMPVFRSLTMDLPEGATVIGDKGYTDYDYEDLLKEAGIELLPIRKTNSKRALPPWVAYIQHYLRKRVETGFSQITQLFPKSIHAVTARGFELKVACFVLAFAFLSSF